MATYLPFLYRAERGRTGGTATAVYCYGIWMRHLVMCALNGLPTAPRVLGEFGPGDSLGIGLAAMLCGTDKLYALDVVRYASGRNSEEILDELVQLFTRRAEIPGPDTLPGVYPVLDDYAFPKGVLSDERLRLSLAPERLERIRAALRGRNTDDISIDYLVPWTERAGEVKLDMALSQAVLEHVDDLPATYRELSRCVRVGGVMSHVIDFRSHRLAETWDGHLQYGPRLWTLVKGRRPYLLNRASPSMHLSLLQEQHFRTVAVARDLKSPATPSSRLAEPFRTWSELDRKTASALMLSVRVEG